MDVTQLPFNRFIGLTQTPGSGPSLPGDPRYTNHLGTVHASALLAVAEAASGDYLVREFGDLGFEVLPVVRRLEAKFRRPALGAIQGSVVPQPEQVAAFRASLAEKGRALLPVAVEVSDEHGTLALCATVEWFVARKQ